jgi:hypothetical protein
MATPKIKIKRGSGAPTSAAIPSAGEMALDTANKALYITHSDGQTPTWIGAEIDNSTTDWTSNTKLTTKNTINEVFLAKTGGEITGSITSPNGSTFSVAIPKLKIKQSNSAAGTGITLQGPATVGTDYAITLPSTQGSSNTFLRNDGSGNLTWASTLTGVTLTELSSGDNTDYGLLMSNDAAGASVSSVKYDFAGDVQGLAPSAPKNGPIKYNKGSGTLTVNGNMIVNGQAANLIRTPTNATITHNATSFILDSVSGLSIGQQVYVNENFSTPAGGGTWVIEFASESLIQSINTSTKTITVSLGITITFNGANSSLISAQTTNLLKFATGTVVLGVDPGNGNSTVNLFNTDVDLLNIGGSASTINLGAAASGTLIVPSSVTVSTGASNTSSLDFNSSTTATANLANSVPATTLNIGGAANTTNLGKIIGTTAIRSNTVNIATDTGSSNKSINIGTGGSGGDANVIIGRSGSNSQTHTIYGKITNTNFGTLGNDSLVTKSYVDSVAISGITSKGTAKAATTANLSATYSNANGTLTNSGTQVAFTIDSVTLAANDTVLIKDQTNAFQNGIYTITTLGAAGQNWVLTRVINFDENTEMVKGSYVFVSNGASNGGKGFILRTAVATVGTDSVTWDIFSQSTAYTFSSGLSESLGAVSIALAANSGLSTSGGLGFASTFPGKGLTLTSGVLTIDGTTEVDYATTGPFNATYSNGSSGVGATLTNNGTQAAFAIDGATPASSTRILVKNQTNTAHNGIYTLTTVGAAGTNWVLTRATDFDVAAELQQLNAVQVILGTANIGKEFNLLTKGTMTVGTTGLLFAESTLRFNSTDSRYFIIGGSANRNITNITPKTITIIATYTVPASNTLSAGISLSFTTSSSILPSDIVPGMKISSIGAQYYTDFVVESINITAGTFTAFNRGSTSITNLPGTASTSTTQNIVFDGANSASPSPDITYDNIGHRGIMVFDKADMTSWSTLGYNTSTTGAYTDGYWSIIRSEADALGIREYPLVTTNTTQTLLRKTLTSPIINTPAIYNPSLLNFTLRTAQNTSTTANNASTVNLTKNFNDTITISEEETNTGLSEISSGVMKFSSPAIRIVDGTFNNTDTTTGLQIFDDNHNLVNGALVQAITTGSVQFTNNSYYYVRVLSPSSIQLYDTYTNAINTGSTAGVINHTNIVTDASNTLRFKVFSNIISLGKPFRSLTDTSGIINGSFVKLAMPNPLSTGYNTDYDIVLGDLNEISITKSTEITFVNAASASTLKWTTSFNGANGLDLNALGNVLVYTDGDLATKKINTRLYDGTTPPTANHIESVTLSGNVMTITLLASQGNKTTTYYSNNYITLSNCTGFANPADNKLVNYLHYITAVSYSAGTGKTTITCALRRQASGTASITNNLPYGIYNYEVKFGMSKRTDFPIGSKVRFSKGTSATPSVNVTRLTGEYNATHEGEGLTFDATLSTRFDIGGICVLCFRLPYILCSTGSSIPFIFGSGLEAEGLNGTVVSSNNYIKLTITQPNADYNTPYSGRRVLLNTLIDCGSY